MERQQRAALYDRVLHAWGEQAQLDMVIEECAELTQALCKLKRKGVSGVPDELIGEIADTQIMLEQLKNICAKRDPTSARRIDEATVHKLERLQQRLERWEEER